MSKRTSRKKKDIKSEWRQKRTKNECEERRLVEERRDGRRGEGRQSQLIVCLQLQTKSLKSLAQSPWQIPCPEDLPTGPDRLVAS